MPDVMHEAARTDYDDAIEVGSDSYECEDVVGVATFPIDRAYGGEPTGQRDPLPIRVYVLQPEDGPDAVSPMGYLTLESAYELREAVDAAILQVELMRDRLRTDGNGERAAHLRPTGEAPA
jgi:hypothetical protein